MHSLLSALPAMSLSLDIGITVPLTSGVNVSAASGVWPGILFGGGVSASLSFLEDAVFPGSSFGIETFSVFRMEHYALPPEYFAAGTYLTMFTIRYGTGLVFRFLDNWSAGAGVVLAGTIGGRYGDSSGYTSDLSPSMLGHTIGISASGGYSFTLIPNTLSIPVKADICWMFTTRNTAALEFGAAAGLIWHIPFTPQHRTNDDADSRRIDEALHLIRLKKYPPAFVLLAAVDAASPRSQQARAIAAAAETEASVYYAPANVTARAKELINAGDPEAALPLLEEALRRNPGNADIRTIITIVKSRNIKIMGGTNR